MKDFRSVASSTPAAACPHCHSRLYDNNELAEFIRNVFARNVFIWNVPISNVFTGNMWADDSTEILRNYATLHSGRPTADRYYYLEIWHGDLLPIRAAEGSLLQRQHFQVVNLPFYSEARPLENMKMREVCVFESIMSNYDVFVPSHWTTSLRALEGNRLHFKVGMCDDCHLQKLSRASTFLHSKRWTSQSDLRRPYNE